MVIDGHWGSLMVIDGHWGSLMVIDGHWESLRFTEGHLTYLFVKGCAAAEDWSRAAQRLERTPVVVKSSHPPTTNPTHADHSYNVGSPIILSNFFTTFHICFLWKILLQLFQESKIWCWGTDSGRIDRCRIRELEGTMRRQGGGTPPSSCVHSGTGGLDHFIRCCVILPGRWFGAGVLVCQKRTCFPPNSLRQNLSHWKEELGGLHRWWVALVAAD